MKENWKKVKLGDVCDLQNGFAFKSNDFNLDGDYKVIKIKEMKQNSIKFTKETSRVSVDINNYDKYIINYKDVLIALTGDPVNKPNPDSWVGRVSQYKHSYKCLLNQRVAKISAKDLMLNNQYLYYYLRQDNVAYGIASQASGSANQANISNAIINSYEITLPALEEQRKIAKILSSIDDKIENNNAISKNLEEMAAALYKRWFVDFEFPNEQGEPYKSTGGEFIDSELGSIPLGWNVGNLSDVATFINGYAFSSKAYVEMSQNTYKVFKMGHIKKGGGFNYSATKNYIEKSDFFDSSQFRLIRGDLLMCMTDMKSNVALLGHTALMTVDNEFLVNQRVGLIRVNNDLGIGYQYLYILTNSQTFLEKLRSKANSGVQVNLSSSAIKGSEILIARKAVNEEFTCTSELLYNKIMNYILENQRLAELRDSLLPKLMSGELEVSNIELDI